MDEGLFWRTMNPARLHALYSARFAPSPARTAPASGSGSLSEYLMGG